MKRMLTILLMVGFGLASAQETNPVAIGAVVASSTNQAPELTNAPPAAPAPPPAAPAQRASAELEKLAMPIALHPDPLIALILPASAYPVEIVQAARFVKDTNNIPKIDQQPWDENVKAMARFPDLIAQMDKDLAWTVELGQAFIDQPKELMDAIQALRVKASQAGTLQSSPQQVVNVTNVVVVETNVTEIVSVTNQIVQVTPANPEVTYVPAYSSTVYAPPLGYVYDPYAPLVTFGVGMAMGAIIANNCDWHGGGVWVGPRGVGVWGGHGDVDVDIDHDVNVNRNADVNRNVNRDVNRSRSQSGNQAANAGANSQQQKWQPNQSRMQTSGAGASAHTREARGWSAASSSSATAQRPTAAGGTRPAQMPASGQGASARTPPSGVSRPSASPGPQQPSGRPTPTAPANRSSTTQPASRPNPQSSPAFSGVNSGGGARNYASRGATSRGGGGARGGGRR